MAQRLRRGENTNLARNHAFGIAGVLQERPCCGTSDERNGKLSSRARHRRTGRALQGRVPDSEVKGGTVARWYGDTEAGRINGSKSAEKEEEAKDRDGEGCNREIVTIT